MAKAAAKKTASKTSSKAKHPAEAFHDSLIPKAAYFTVYLKLMRLNTINEKFPTIVEAAARANDLSIEHKGKTPIIYAIMPDGIEPRQVLVTPATLAEMLGNKAPAAAEVAPAPKSAKADKPSKVEKAKPALKAKAEPAARPQGKRAEALAAAESGKLPAKPDFSAPTHERFRAKLDAVHALVKAADIKGLKAFEINPVSSSPKAIARYRDLAVIALTARAATAKAA